MTHRGLFTAFFFPEGYKLTAFEGDNNGKSIGG